MAVSVSGCLSETSHRINGCCEASAWKEEALLQQGCGKPGTGMAILHLDLVSATGESLRVWNGGEAVWMGAGGRVWLCATAPLFQSRHRLGLAHGLWQVIVGCDWVIEAMAG